LQIFFLLSALTVALEALFWSFYLVHVAAGPGGKHPILLPHRREMPGVLNKLHNMLQSYHLFIAEYPAGLVSWTW
jgi:hypothetical protein